MSHLAAYLLVCLCLATAAGHGKRAALLVAVSAFALLCFLFAVCAWLAEWLWRRRGR